MESRQGGNKPVNSTVPVIAYVPGNVVRGNQKLCKGNLYGCTQP